MKRVLFYILTTLLWIIFAIVTAFGLVGAFEFDDPTIPHINPEEVPVGIGGGNSSWNETLGDLLYWRLDAANNPPSSDWDMGGNSFLNVNTVYLNKPLSSYVTESGFFRTEPPAGGGNNIGLSATDGYVYIMDSLIIEQKARQGVIGNFSRIDWLGSSGENNYTWYQDGDGIGGVFHFDTVGTATGKRYQFDAFLNTPYGIDMSDSQLRFFGTAGGYIQFDDAAIKKYPTIIFNWSDGVPGGWWFTNPRNLSIMEGDWNFTNTIFSTNISTQYLTVNNFVQSNGGANFNNLTIGTSSRFTSSDVVIFVAGSNAMTFQTGNILSYKNIIPTNLYQLGNSTNRWGSIYSNGYYDNAGAYPASNNIVALSGSQTITGVKTFPNVIVSNAVPHINITDASIGANDWQIINADDILRFKEVTINQNMLDMNGDRNQFYVNATDSTFYGGINVTQNLRVQNNLIVDKNVDITGNIVIDGNLSVKRPYAMFSDNTTQVIAVANTAYPVNFSITEDSYLVDISSNRQNITFAQQGDYLIELSAVVTTDLPNKHIEIWVQKNGVNVPRSNTKLEMGSAGIEQVISVPFILDMLTTDNMRIMWASDDAGSSMVYTTNTSYSPETPSIIMTISKISEIT